MGVGLIREGCEFGGHDGFSFAVGFEDFDVFTFSNRPMTADITMVVIAIIKRNPKKPVSFKVSAIFHLESKEPNPIGIPKNRGGAMKKKIGKRR